MGALSRLDRRLGCALREATGAVPGGARCAHLVARAMSPAFRLAVAALIARRDTRRAGLEALGLGAVASIAARMLRDRLGRPRPGARADGGFPSRHAAAAVAIARAVGRHDAAAGRALTALAAAGLLARVASAEHEPGDVVAGALLGALAAGSLEWIAGDRIG